MATVLLVLAGVAGPVGPAQAAPPEQNCVEPGQEAPVDSWAQRLLAPQRVWPLTRGENVIVAVLGSGVDAGHPQLRGRVAAGFDATTGTGPANTDCLGVGTQVAGAVGAQAAPPVQVTGVAPQAGIVPVRVVPQGVPAGQIAVDPAMLARGIDWAVSQHVAVVCVAVVTYTASPDLQRAVEGALAQGVVVVSAVGDRGDPKRYDNPKPYPAAYPGVLAVSALAATGYRWTNSGYGPFVRIAAPGAAVPMPQRVKGLVLADNPGVAAGFVAGSVALLLARETTRGNRLTPDAVLKRVEATATPAPHGAPSNDYGSGVVNPYRLVTEGTTDGRPDPLPALQSSPLSQEARDRAAAWARSEHLALWLTLAVVVLVVVVIGAGAALPRGRRRHWRPGLAPPPRQRSEPAEPGPPVLLFEEPERR